MRRLILAFVLVAALFFDPSAHGKEDVNKGVVKDILKQGEVVCGVSLGLPGFSEETFPGVFEGFDVDYCRAVAAALFGDSEAVLFVPVSAGERFDVLIDRDIDVLIRNTTHTFTRDADGEDRGTGLHFAPTTFHDGQGFMTDLATTDIGNVEDLLDFLEEEGGRSVCVPLDTTSLQNLLDLGVTIVETDGPSGPAYDAGDCDVMSTDKSALAAQIGDLSNPSEQLIFEVTISKEPLGPVTSYGDQQWSDIVDWVVYATFFAEEHGITEENVDEESGPFGPWTAEEERFLGISGDLGASLGLSQDWAIQVILAVGNYEEIYDRNLGPSGPIVPIGIPRFQQNKSHVDGGLLFAPPFR